jgi:dolichyl-phosphate-mannose-protein mannosyltransferase
VNKLLLGFFLLLAFVFCSFRLGIPNHLVFDETYYVPAASALLAGKADPNNVHPPLAKLLMAGSIRIFGNKPFAWRFPSLLSFMLALFFFFILANDLFSQNSVWLPLGASLLYLFDGISYVQSRIAMLDMPMTGFLIPSIYCFRKQKYWLSSIFLGLSLLCKWGGFFILPVYLLWIPYRGDIKKSWNIFLQLFVPAFVIYFIGFNAISGGLGHWFPKFFSQHLEMLKFHLRPTMEHPYKAPWWKWVLLIRPIWYAFKQTGNTVHGIIALPNPILWWLGLAGVLLLPFRFNDEKARFIFALFFFFTVSWAISIKGGFMYYLLPASPFLVLGLVYWIQKSKVLFGIVLSIACISFFFFFPLYAYLPIPYGYYAHMMWLHTWI